MKSKLHTTLSLMVFGLLFVGAQAVSAQGYQGVPYTNPFANGLPLEVGTAVGAEDKIQLEYFDAMPNEPNGVNIGDANPVNGVPGTFFDKNAAGDEPVLEETSTLRRGTEVDLVDRTDPEGNTPITVLTANQGQEYQLFTVNVLTSGMYTIKARYSHTSSTGKRLQVFMHSDPTDLSTSSVVMNSSASGTNPPNMEATYNIDELGEGELPAYGYSLETEPFEAQEGTRLFRVRHLSAGWQVDYISFELKETLSTEGVSLKNELKVYPNPSNSGQFQLTVDSKWDVYSLLGAKVLEGEGKTVDLNSAGISKGTYILKTEYETKKIIFN